MFQTPTLTGKKVLTVRITHLGRTDGGAGLSGWCLVEKMKDSLRYRTRTLIEHQTILTTVGLLDNVGAADKVGDAEGAWKRGRDRERPGNLSREKFS